MSRRPLDLGAVPRSIEGVSFRVWAPRLRSLAVELTGPPARVIEMARGDGDVFEVVVPEASAGVDYALVVDGERRLPDPTSRHQPKGPHGPSRVVDAAAFSWTDADWAGRPLEEYVLYELHVGTFTPEGTFDAAIGRLDDLAALGVTAVEPMPVAEFPGGRNWGYDGVDLFAVQSTYGGPEAFARFVDACHARGLAVVLDVVYNHIGPEGNYLGVFAPYFSDRYRTPWGDALNFDGPDSDGVRRFFIDNAVHWLRHYHVDALRLDAVHGIYDFSARHVLEELQASFAAEAAQLGRRAFIIAESDLNDVRIINPRERGGYGLDAQWSDDFHHSVHGLLVGSRRGYFADFGSVSDLDAAIVRGYVYDGRYSPYRRRRHGNSAADRPGEQFVVFVQNHDQVANGSQGKRHGTLLSLEQQKLAACLLLTAPNVPLLFMGQEYGETRPFDYFVSHGDSGLVEAVRAGRRREHEAFDDGGAFADPQDEATFRASTLDWSARGRAPHAQLLSLTHDLLVLRRTHPALAHLRRDLTRVWSDDAERTLVLERRHPSGQRAVVVFNLSAEARAIPISAPPGPLKLALWTGDPRYAGPKDAVAPPSTLQGPVGPTCAAWSAAIYLG